MNLLITFVVILDMTFMIASSLVLQLAQASRTGNIWGAGLAVGGCVATWAAGCVQGAAAGYNTGKTAGDAFDAEIDRHSETEYHNNRHHPAVDNKGEHASTYEDGPLPGIAGDYPIQGNVGSGVGGFKFGGFKFGGILDKISNSQSDDQYGDLDGNTVLNRNGIFDEPTVELSVDEGQSDGLTE